MSPKPGPGSKRLPAGQHMLSCSDMGGQKRLKLIDVGVTVQLQPNRGTSGSAFTECPVCGKQVPLLCINLHLDVQCTDLNTRRTTAIAAAAARTPATGTATAAIEASAALGTRAPDTPNSRPGAHPAMLEAHGWGRGVPAAEGLMPGAANERGQRQREPHCQRQQQQRQFQLDPRGTALGGSGGTLQGGAAAEAAGGVALAHAVTPPSAEGGEAGAERNIRPQHNRAPGTPCVGGALTLPNVSGRAANGTTGGSRGGAAGCGSGGLGAGAVQVQARAPAPPPTTVHPMFLARGSLTRQGPAGRNSGQQPQCAPEVEAEAAVGSFGCRGAQRHVAGGAAGCEAAEGGIPRSEAERGIPMLQPVANPRLEGQYVISEFVTAAEEAELLALCDDPALRPSWSSWSGQPYESATAQKTRGKRWGVLPDYHRRSVAPQEHPLPPLLRLLAERMRTRVGLLRAFAPNEANAIDYRRSRGSWLRPHVDDRILSGDCIVNLCLAGAAVMSFSGDRRGDKARDGDRVKGQAGAGGAAGPAHAAAADGSDVRVLLAPRSLQILSRAARYSFTHAIAPADLLDERRVSITFRRSELRPFERPG